MYVIVFVWTPAGDDTSSLIVQVLALTSLLAIEKPAHDEYSGLYITCADFVTLVGPPVIVSLHVPDEVEERFVVMITMSSVLFAETLRAVVVGGVPVLVGGVLSELLLL